ncbi:hypothetical protein HanXRQr2_Chr13g0583381 [Helianthus annuus]|uniref:Uncharacterized protein n=1 Tax=Helianthus annuus TaxID=4232 RepID=A0A251SQZ4_HELAN|nr:hypothetical protein HanXRQr2_Chr13g0583381 [Helianthus annuus]
MKSYNIHPLCLGCLNRTITSLHGKAPIHFLATAPTASVLANYSYRPPNSFTPPNLSHSLQFLFVNQEQPIIRINGMQIFISFYLVKSRDRSEHIHGLCKKSELFS